MTKNIQHERHCSPLSQSHTYNSISVCEWMCMLGWGVGGGCVCVCGGGVIMMNHHGVYFCDYAVF